jgi:hypothetical protein
MDGYLNFVAEALAPWAGRIGHNIHSPALGKRRRLSSVEA